METIKPVEFPLAKMFGKDILWLRCRFRIDPEICELELVDTEPIGIEGAYGELFGVGLGMKFEVKVQVAEGTEPCKDQPGTCRRIVHVYADISEKIGLVFHGTRHLATVEAIFSTACSEACCDEPVDSTSHGKTSTHKGVGK